MLNDKVILITGGTGSFGKKLTRTILDRYTPRKLIIFSRDELKQYEMEQTLSAEDKKYVRFFLGNVRDSERLDEAFRGVDYIIHAAALKQVPAAEYNPFEAIKTNVLGAQNITQAAIRSGVKKVVALSTDKAASPINLYGATKLCSDKLFVAANSMSGAGGTCFSVVRYGNVVGSRGSVIPFFVKKAEDGGVLPITDERMTRFSITLQKGVDFVLENLERMHGGEIFVPKIPSYKICDVATAVSPESKTEEIGIRPGEKLHEMMISEDDSRDTLEFEDYFVIQPAFHWWTGEDVLKRDGGKKCAEAFSYVSNNNKEWMSVEEIRALVDEYKQEHK